MLILFYILRDEPSSGTLQNAENVQLRWHFNGIIKVNASDEWYNVCSYYGRTSLKCYY